MAPEVVMCKPHYMPCDWWSIGILVFEMLTGGTPFDSSSEESFTIFQSVLSFAHTGTPAPSFSWFFNRQAKDLILQLLVASPEGRLDAAAAMAHPFLAEIDQLELERKALPAPFVPVIENEHDTSNFDTEAYEDDSDDDDDDDDDDEVKVVDSTRDAALDERCQKAKLFPTFEALPSMQAPY
jgi:ribosomal protein S6 kinase alpha-5